MYLIILSGLGPEVVMKAALWIFVLIIAPFVIAKVDQWRKRGIGDTWAWWKSENMPPELRSATLFLSEQDVSTTLPVPMHGRVDQVYQTKRGILIPWTQSYVR